jgi:hypothetical protein
MMAEIKEWRKYNWFDKTIDVTRLDALTSLTSFGLWTSIGQPMMKQTSTP